MPLVYDPQYWSLVFPLGMFTASTFVFARALGLDFLLIIPRLTIYVALGAWVCTFVGMIRQIARLFFERAEPQCASSEHANTTAAAGR